jgi:sugar (pentulose or hexulose) kinase
LKAQPATLIFDIGKTTKKALIFDESFHPLEEKTETFKEIADEDGFPSDDLPTVSGWVKDIFHQYINDKRYSITQANVSGYGASLVHLDSHGKIIEPFYNYLKPFPPTSQNSFFSSYDQKKDILAVTASPFLGLLNSGLQLYWLKKEQPAKFRTIQTSLHLPQYFTYLLTGMKFTDITSVGCHTMLWDFHKKDYHHWVDAEGIRKLFPPITKADHTFDINIDGRKIKMSVGVHDSSAALMPYLVTQRDPFLLLSTGTWNICFNPFNAKTLTAEELASDCLSYITHAGTPVKASRIFLGHEHEVQAEAISKHFNVPLDFYKSIRFNDNVYEKLVSDGNGQKIFYPLGMEGTGPIPAHQANKTDYSLYSNVEEAYHQFIRYLVKWQLLSIDLIDPGKKVKNIIVVGGFTKNPLFLEILKRTERDRKIQISDHPRASALGAAWLVSDPAAYTGKAGLLSVAAV